MSKHIAQGLNLYHFISVYYLVLYVSCVSNYKAPEDRKPVKECQEGKGEKFLQEKCRIVQESAHMWETRPLPFQVSYLKITTQQRWPFDICGVTEHSHNFPLCGSKAVSSVLHENKLVKTEFKSQRDYTHLYKKNGCTFIF